MIDWAWAAPDFALGIRWLLVLVFGAAIVGKVAARPSTLKYLGSLGLKGDLALASFWALVAAEVGTVALLVLEPRVGGAVAAGMFVVFSVALFIGRRSSVPCSCLGSLGSGSGNAPLGRRLLIRALGIGGGVMVGLSAGQHASTGRAAAVTVAGVAVMWLPGVVRGLRGRADVAESARDTSPASGSDAAGESSGIPQLLASPQPVERRNFVKGIAIAAGGLAGLVPGVAFARSANDHCGVDGCEWPDQCVCRSVGGLALLACECITHHIPDDTPPVYCCADCYVQCQLCCECNYVNCIGLDVHAEDLYACSFCEGLCLEGCHEVFLKCVGDGLNGSGDCVTTCPDCDYSFCA